MDSINWRNTLVISGPVLCGLAFKLIKNSFNKPPDDDDAINEVLFYGAKKERHTKDIGMENLLCISYVIAQASETVDVCVPSLESDALAKCLINVQQRKYVKIRVAIHNSSDFRQLSALAKNCVEVKVIRSDVKFEHEFMVVDADSGNALALLGALDNVALHDYSRRDNTIITSDAKVIFNLQREFNRIWNSAPDVVHAKDYKK